MEPSRKKTVELHQAKWLIEPGCVLLVSSGDTKKANVMTISWQTPIHTANPFRFLLVMRRNRYSYELIDENSELVVNIPGEELLEAVHTAGVISGRGIDKFRKCGLTAEPSVKAAPPRVAECAGHLECRVMQRIPVGTHDLLICEPLVAAADPRKFDRHWITEQHKTLHYMNGTLYGVMDRTISAATGEVD